MLNLLGSQPWASAADIFYIITYPLLLAGLLALPRHQPRAGGAVATMLDIGGIVTAAGAAMWVLLVEPTLVAGGAGAGVLQKVIALAYPVGDLLLLWASLDLLCRGRVRTAPGVAMMLAGGAAMLIATDLAYAVQILRGTYANGNPLGILWCIALTLLGLAGARQATMRSADEGRVLDRRMATAVLAALALVASWAVLLADPGDAVPQAAAGISVLLVLVRQLHALAVNRRLEADLHLMNSVLEERVRERTEELAQVQHRLAEAARLESVGRVAGAVAHDFNNILTAVSGHAELARMRSDDPTIHDHLEHVVQAVQRASELGRRLVATSKPVATERRPIDLAAIATEVAGQISAGLPKEVRLAVDAPKGGAQVLADGTQVHQMLMNLCVNARDAMPDGGQIGISIAPAGGWVELAVSDTGSGMSDNVRAHLFEPYFTTKTSGRGTGLGLATVHAIVRQHGGSIDVETTPGRGSVFRVRLPAG